MGKDPTTNLALVELFLASISPIGRDNGVGFVNVLTVTLLVHYVVPIRLEALTAHLKNGTELREGG